MLCAPGQVPDPKKWLTLGALANDSQGRVLCVRQRLPSRRTQAAQPQVHRRAAVAAALRMVRLGQRGTQIHLPVGQAVVVDAGSLCLLPQLLRRQQAVYCLLRLASAEP
jgi:hypothetical protein